MKETVEQFYQELKDLEAARMENVDYAEYVEAEFDATFDDGLH